MKKVYAVQLAAGLVFSVSISTLTALAQSPPAATSSEDLALKREAMDLDVKKTWISALGIGVPIFVAVLTLAGTVMAARGTMKAQFTSKVAELALQGEGPDEVLNRANLLARLYEDLLPSDFAARVDALSKDGRDKIRRIVTGPPYHAKLKEEIIEQLAKYPEQRKQLITDYMNIIPETKHYLGSVPSTSEESKAEARVSAAPAQAEGISNFTSVLDHAQLKKEIIEQLAKYPLQRQQILADYIALSPETESYLRPVLSTSEEAQGNALRV